MTNEIKDFKLNRTGESDLAFSGTHLAGGKSPAYRRHELNARAKCHWFEADVYQTKGGKYVLSVRYRWSGEKLFREKEQDIVTVHSDQESMNQYLDAFEPTTMVNGYPDSADDYYKDKQETLMRCIEEDFGMLVENIDGQLKKLDAPEVIE